MSSMCSLPRAVGALLLSGVGVLGVAEAARAQAPTCRNAVVTPASTVHIGPAAQEFMFDVSATESYQCLWAPVTSDVPWLTLGFVYFAPGAPGFFGNITANVARNDTGVARTGHLTLHNGMGTITITQDPVACASVPATVRFPRAGGTLTVPVTTTSPQCAWNAAIEGPIDFWLTLEKQGSPVFFFGSRSARGVGPASLTLTATSNENGAGPRNRQIRIGESVITVDQEEPLCVFSITPASFVVPAGGGGGTVSLTGTGTDCRYTAAPSTLGTDQSRAGFVLTSGASGTAPSTIAYQIAPLATNETAQFFITVGGANAQIDQSAPSVVTDRQRGLAFTVFRGNTPFTSSAETVRITNAETPSAGWSASVDQPWVTLSPPSGTGSGLITVRVDSAQAALLVPGHYSATIAIQTASPAQGTRRMPVSLAVAATGVDPIAKWETAGAGQTGAVGITGWAVDDIGIASVDLYRDRAAVEGPGPEVFIGTATRVRDARPDVERGIGYRVPGEPFFRPYPEARMAGWGYMLLTNMLPGGGNTPTTLKIYITDRDGHRMLLGSSTLTYNNATAMQPFGTIDFPAQGQTVSGTIENIGWVLTPAGKAIPLDGSTIKVYIDGALVGPVSAYNLPRPDVKGFFPGLANSNGPEARLSIDTALLANGVHTIEWGVIDDAGVPQGIGSRYFTVQNGAASQVRGNAAASRASTTVDALPALGTEVWSRHGIDDRGWFSGVETDADGGRTVRTTRGRRIELLLDPMFQAGCGEYAGHLVTGDVAAPLPPGASLDRARGILRWQPGVEFAGTYRFSFVQRGCDGVERQLPITIAIGDR